MTDFKKFKHTTINNGVQYLKFFPNGYGVSVIKHDFSYGHELGLWELAVLKGNLKEWDLCYDTPITAEKHDGVIGFLNEDEVNDLVDQVKAL